MPGFYRITSAPPKPTEKHALAAGYQIYAVNPYTVSHYRGRHGSSRAKSDRGDAKVLAELVRTDRHNTARSLATARWPSGQGPGPGAPEPGLEPAAAR
jgi:Transposase